MSRKPSVNTSIPPSAIDAETSGFEAEVEAEVEAEAGESTAAEVDQPLEQTRVLTPVTMMAKTSVKRGTISPELVQRLADTGQRFDLVKSSIRLPFTSPELRKELERWPWKRTHLEVQAWEECRRRYLSNSYKNSRLRQTGMLERKRAYNREMTRSLSPTAMKWMVKDATGPFDRSGHKYVEHDIFYKPPADDDDDKMLPSRWSASSPLSFLPPIRPLPDTMKTALARHDFRARQDARTALMDEVYETQQEIESMEDRAARLGERRERKDVGLQKKESQAGSRMNSRKPSLASNVSRGTRSPRS